MYSARLMITVAPDKDVKEALTAFAAAVGCEVYTTGIEVTNPNKVQVTVHGTENISEEVFSQFDLQRPDWNPAESDVRFLAKLWGLHTGYFSDVEMGIGPHL